MLNFNWPTIRQRNCFLWRIEELLEMEDLSTVLGVLKEVLQVAGLAINLYLALRDVFKPPVEAPRSPADRPGAVPHCRPCAWSAGGCSGAVCQRGTTWRPGLRWR